MKRILLLALLSSASQAANLIFETTFDDLEDWHSGLPQNSLNPYGQHDGNIFAENLVDTVQSIRTSEWAPKGHIIPAGFFSVRQAGQNYSPRNGYPEHHENIEILSANANKALGNQGKSLVFWREPTQDNNWFWMTDSILTIYLPNAIAGQNVFDKTKHQGLQEVYYEYWITFDNHTTEYPEGQRVGHSADMSKISRVYSFDERRNEFRGFDGGSKGPSVVWGWQSDLYGTRNMMTLRGGPHGHDYNIDYRKLGMPHQNGSLNYTSMVEGQGPNHTTERQLDRQNGGLITSGTIRQKQIFGDQTQWARVGFYVKMNSAPDVADGVLIQWLNGRRLLTLENVPFIGSERHANTPEPIAESGMVGWNMIGLGGNDFFHSWPKESMREEWIAMDNLRIYDGLPAHAETDIDEYFAPLTSPQNFKVEKQ